MTPPEPRPRRTRISLLVAALGIALGAVGAELASPLGTALHPGPPARAAARHATGAGAGTGAGSLSPRAVYARVEPSVVNVTATLRYDGEIASGTGLVIDPRAALVLTNNHVIRDATSVTVTIPRSGLTYRARIVGVAVPADIAVLRIGPGPGLASAPLGDSATVRPGTRVIAIGNRAGAGGVPALASGVISGTGQTIRAADGISGFTETLHGMLATTARIQPGDSGGPLADSAGAVIGIDTAAGADGAAPGYAIPINTALGIERRIAAGLPGPGITLGGRGFLGIIAGPAAARPRAARRAAGGQPAPARSRPPGGCLPTRTGAGRPAMVAPARSGAVVYGVLCGTAAAAAGIAAGDVITMADGRPVASPGALTAIVTGCRPGTVVAVTWLSPLGATRTSLVRLGTAPAM